ncbi:MAG TPA: TonB-dependent receptor [Kofleriaceae bacterium]|nr:TonB-dependent receptor [Kofleriaceae bacterium]
MAPLLLRTRAMRLRSSLVPAVAVMAVAAIVAPAHAEPREITGIVVEAATGEPVADAIVVAGNGDPVITDSSGRFTIRVNGSRQLLVTAAGFGDRTVAIRRSGKASLRIELTLSDDAEIIELEGTAPDQGPQTWELTPDQIRALPGAGNDVLKAVQSLPGVARIPFGLGGLVIRGQSPRDTNVYLDGIEVPLAFHFFGLASFYPATMLESLEVENGGHGAAHGRGQGGLVTLTSKAPRRDGWSGGGEVSILDAQARAEGPTGIGAISIGVRRSYIDGILRAVLPEEDRFLPRYYDSQIRWDAGDTRKRGLLTMWMFTSNDRMADDQTSFTEAFVRFGARYKRQLGATTLSVTPWAGRDILAFVDEGDPEDPDRERSELSRTQWPVGVRGDVVRDARWGHVAGGIDVQGGRYGRLAIGEPEDMDGGDGPTVMIPDVARWSADVGLWAEARYRVRGDKVVVKPGLRFEYYGLSDEVVLDPRLQVTHTLSPRLVVRESVGLYHQPPTAADTDPDFGNPALDSAFTLQTSVGAETVGPLGIQIGVTAFAHRGWNQPVAVRAPAGSGFDNPAGPGSGIGAVMLELLEEQLGSFEYRDNVGESVAYGVELGVKHQVGRFLGWGSYTLTKARRKDDPARFEGWRAYQLDQLHNLSIVGSVLVGKWQLGARFRLVTGNPYTPIIDGDQDIMGRPLSQRLPDFIQVDLRADRAWKRDWGTMKLFIDVQHATWPLRDNYEDAGWDYENDRPSFQKGLPILPMFGLEYVN